MKKMNKYETIWKQHQIKSEKDNGIIFIFKKNKNHQQLKKSQNISTFL